MPRPDQRASRQKTRTTTRKRRRPASAVKRAELLIRHGRYQGAARILRLALAAFDPDTAPADLDLITVAILFAHVGDRTPRKRMKWAWFAHTACQRTYGPLHPLSLTASDALSQARENQGSPGEAIRMREGLAVMYGAVRNIEVAATVAARCCLAELLHQDGRCAEAEHQIKIARRLWSPHRDVPKLRELGVMVVMSHAAIRAGCGRHHAAVSLLQHAQPLLDAVDQRRRATHGLRGYSKIADIIRDHPRRCTRPPRNRHTDESLRAYHAAYEWLLYKEAALEIVATTIRKSLDDPWISATSDVRGQ